MTNPFLPATPEDKQRDFHVITTDHPHMSAIGLDVFTTGNLYNWLNQKDGDGVYKNRKLLFGGQTGGVQDPSFIGNGMDEIMGGSSKGADDWGVWHGWRKRGATGTYKKQSHSSWSYTYETLIIDYSLADVPLGGLTLPVDYVSPVGESTADGWNTTLLFEAGDANDQLASVNNSTNPIWQIINLNRWMNSFKRNFPKNDWYKSTQFSAKSLFAIDAFLSDIKASKYGYVEFYSYLTFNISILENSVQCTKSDKVKFKLYLYDDSRVRNTQRLAVLKDPKFGGYKVDPLGRTYKTTVDGEAVDVDTNDPSQQVVGDLDRMWNPVTKKWESGTPNMMAKLVGDVDAAVNNPTVASLIDSDVGADLDGDEDRHFAPSSGLAMPVQPQNGNPMQWQPNYAQSSGCRGQGGVDDTVARRKQQVIAYNFNPLKAYAADTLVMLSKIGGVWHITDMGSGISLAEQPASAAINGKWQFQYLATNSRNYFTGYSLAPDASVAVKQYKVSPPDVERNVHHLYYRSDPDPVIMALNCHRYDAQNKFVGSGVEFNENFSTIGARPFSSSNGWWQFTSFDFMDRLVGGTRVLNALGTTNAAETSAGVPIPPGDNGPYNNGAFTGSFFGCIFPDGYKAARTRPYFSERAWFTQGIQNPLYASNGTDYFNAQPMLANELPFIDKGTIERDPNTGEMTKYGAVRSDQMYPVNLADVEKEIDPEENTFFYRSGRQAPSMFYQESENGKTTLKHLPADIATNASPSGTNGCPIPNVHALPYMTYHLYDSPTIQMSCAKATQSNAWLRKDDGLAADDTKYTPNDSAFDFKPVRPNKVQFKPLKMETYAQFFPFKKGDVIDKPAENVGDWAKYGTAGFDERLRASFSAQGNWFTMFGDRPASIQSEDRNKNALSPLSYTHNLYDVTRGLGFNIDILPITTGPNQNNIPPRDFPTYSHFVHTQSFFNGCDITGKQPWMICKNSAHSEGDGANAFGVIGAICTVTANSQIGFETDQCFGMSSFRFAPRLGQTKFNSYGTCGGSTRDYNTNRSTQLSATLYQAHPRELTIYDARYFAVHHFNVEPWRRIDPTHLTKGLNPLLSGVKFPKGDGTLKTVNIHTRTLGTLSQNDVDIREPSSYPPNEADGDAITLPKNTLIWNNSNSYNQTKVMPTRYWNINPIRTGRLLPFRYYYNAVGIPWVSGAKFDLNDANFTIYSGAIPEDGVQANNSMFNGKLVIRHYGSGYNVGDVIGNSAGNVMMSVTKTMFNPITGANGAIQEVQVFDRGRGIEPSQSVNSGELIKPSTAAGLGISTIAGLGKKFSGYFTATYVYNDIGTDQKPLQLDSNEGRLLKLTRPMNSEAIRNNDVLGGGNQYFGITVGNKVSSVNIEPTQRSPDNKYDIFFHFVNDISHTWMSNRLADGNGTPGFTQGYPVPEQFVDLNISTI